MHSSDVTQQFATLDGKMSRDEYNFEHFRTKHLLADMQATFAKQGIQPGELAPDFEIPRVGGGSVRLSNLRDKPVLLHLGSYT